MQERGETLILLQAFSKTVIGPVFFEFIDQDQIDRGVLKAG